MLPQPLLLLTLACQVVCRTREERAASPERLNLDGQRLTVCPVLQGEQRLRLLNYQSNLLLRISNVANLPNLIFLDLYNNQIQAISGLELLPGLRVLMLGKNRIRSIQGLGQNTKLDVLDLHSNEIESIEGLGALASLRVLNLAGNRIRALCQLEGQLGLTELNVRRNAVTDIDGVRNTPALQRLFLSHNKLGTLKDLEVLGSLPGLVEMSAESNPVCRLPSYRASLITTISNLSALDASRVLDEERREAAKAVLRKASAAHAGGGRWRADASPRASAVDPSTPRASPAHAVRVEKIREVLWQWEQGEGRVPGGGKGAAGFWELEGSKLWCYGSASLLAVALPAHAAVTSVIFKFIAFDLLAKGGWIQRCYKLTRLSSLTLSHNKLRDLRQLRVLEGLPIRELHVTDNPISKLITFPPMACYCLPALESINSVELSQDERQESSALFRVAIRDLNGDRSLTRTEAATAADKYVGQLLQQQSDQDVKMRVLRQVFPAIVDALIVSAVSSST